MTPERWRRVEELYHAALTRGKGERMAFLANECVSDEALRLEVESLLAQRDRQTVFSLAARWRSQRR